MYCNIPVYLSHMGTQVLLVVTEIEYCPEQKGGINCEPLPESCGINAGYVLCEDGEFEFEDVLEKNATEVIQAALNWYKEVDCG